MLLISFITALGGLLFGTVIAVIAGATPLIVDEFNLNQFQISTLVSCILLGAGSGALLSGKTVDRLGRKSTILLCALMYLIGTLICTYTHSFNVLVVGRFIAGIALGVCSFTVPMYISEIAPPEHRGKFVMLNSIALTFGIMLAYVINLIFTPSGDWRLMFLTAGAPAILLAMGIIYLPESPRWLMLRGKESKAKDILKTLRKETCIKSEFNAIQQTIGSHKCRWRDLLKPKAIQIVGVGIALAFIQQITGINTIFFYAPMLFAQAGFSGQALLYIPLVIGFINFFTTIIALLWIDHLGRRRFMLGGLWTMLAALCVMVWMFSIPDFTYASIIIVLAAIVFVGSYAMSAGCMFWVLIAEIFPTNIRAKAMGIATASNWFCNFVVIMTFLPMSEYFGIRNTFALYTVACIISIIFTKKYVPETKAVSLEHIQTNLMAGKKLREIGAPI